MRPASLEDSNLTGTEHRPVGIAFTKSIVRLLDRRIGCNSDFIGVKSKILVSNEGFSGSANLMTSFELAPDRPPLPG